MESFPSNTDIEINTRKTIVLNNCLNLSCTGKIMNKELMTTLIKLPKIINSEMKILAVEKEITKNEIMVIALKEYINRNKKD